MAKSAGDAGLTLNGTVAEMLALQQTGGLISSKVLPFFAKNMSLAAKANGGLNKALLSNRVAMNRLAFSFSEAADTIFKSGLSEGLTEFFNVSAKTIRDLAPLWRGLGKIFGSVFKGLASLIEAVTPFLTAFGEIVDDITESFGDLSASLLIVSPLMATMFSPLMRKGALSLLSVFSKLAIPITAISLAIQEAAFWMEELLNIGSTDKIGILWDPRKGIDQSVLSNFFDFANQDIQKVVNAISKGGTGLTGKLPTTNVTVELNVGAERMAAAVGNTDTMRDIIIENIAPSL